MRLLLDTVTIVWWLEASPRLSAEAREAIVEAHEVYEGYAKPSLKKYRPIAARNEDKKVFSGLL